MRFNSLRFLAAVSVMGALAASSQALLVDPTGATLLGSGDDSAFAFTTNSFSLFGGAGSTSWFACTNGFISTTSNTSFSNSAFPLASSIAIAPWWDDMFSSGTGQGVFDQTGTGMDAVTWNTSYFSSVNGQGVATFQALLISSNQTIQGFNFLAGDIAFSFDSLGTAGTGGTIGTATSGINKGDGLTAVNSSGMTGAANNGANVALWTSGRNFYLFRSNGQGGYDASIQQAPVPEPASMAVLGLGALALLRRRRR